MTQSLETLKEILEGSAHAALRTTKLLAYISQRKLSIFAEQEKIRRLYTKLGKVYYKDFVTDEEPDEAEYNPLCQRISECYRRINDLREEILEAKEAYKAEKGQVVLTESEEDVEIVPYLPETTETQE